MSAVERIASVHEKVALAAMDCAADELRDSVNGAARGGGWEAPPKGGDAEQDAAVIRVQEAREALEEQLEMFVGDRYGFDSCVSLGVM